MKVLLQTVTTELRKGSGRSPDCQAKPLRKQGRQQSVRSSPDLGWALLFCFVDGSLPPILRLGLLMNSFGVFLVGYLPSLGFRFVVDCYNYVISVHSWAIASP